MRHSKHVLSRCLLSLLGISGVYLTGCSQAFNAVDGAVGTGSDLRGAVFGGELPVVGGKIYLYAAPETGYGVASTSLLTSAVLTDPVATPYTPGKDGNGNYYVTTNSTGSWAFTTNDWPCTAGTDIYLLAIGGSQGGAGSNPNASFMTALGNCSNINSSTSITINEITTVGSVYALSGFMSSPTQVSSNSTAASIAGMNAAFATMGNLVNITTGAPLTTTPSGTGTVPYQTINTLANILAACVNTTGGSASDATGGSPTACGQLFYDTTTSGGTAPTNTVQAALNLVHNPAIDPGGNLYNLIQSYTPFNPFLGSTPADWTLPIIFTGGGMSNLYDIAVDGNNNIWAVSDGAQSSTGGCTSATGSSVFEMTNLGVIKSGSKGYTSSTYLFCPFGVTLDTSGNAWVTQDYAGKSYLVKITSTGTVSGITPTTGDGGYFNNGAFDASGNLWLSNYTTNYISKYNVSANSWTKYTGGGVTADNAAATHNESWGVAADGLGHMWFADNDATGLVSEFNVSNGTAVSSTGYSAGSIAYPLRLAVDQNNTVWVGNFGSSASASPGTTVSALTNAGAAVTGSPFSLGTLIYGYAPFGMAVDGGNHVWTANASTYGVSEIDANTGDIGTVLSPNYGFIGTVASPVAAAMVFPEAVAVDEAGNLWVANYGYYSATAGDDVAASITELVGAATPTLTPIAAATALGTPAAKP
jgi:hypothetical protein